jgi:3-methyladenine DNA glycosylase AlkD
MSPASASGPGVTAAQIVKELEPLGLGSIKKVLRNHGAQEPVFGVKIEELKKFQKRIKTNYQLALDLYDTGIYDAMYLAGLIADDGRMSKADLKRWIARSNCPALSECTVAWVAAQGRHGHDLALEWIESREERVAAAGWSTLSSLMAIKADADLDLDELRGLLRRVQASIHEQPNRVRHAMNGFVIAAGSFVAPLTELALDVAAKIGGVTVNMGATACVVPDAASYIRKVEARGYIGRKKKTVKC